MHPGADVSLTGSALDKGAAAFADEPVDAIAYASTGCDFGGRHRGELLFGPGREMGSEHTDAQQAISS